MSPSTPALLQRLDELSGKMDHAGVEGCASELLGRAELPDRERSTTLHALAHSLINQGRPREADPLWAEIVALTSPHPQPLCEAHVAIGYAHAAAGNHPLARAAFSCCLAVEGGMDCHRASARFHTMRSHEAEGRQDQAQVELEAFLQMPGAYPEEKREALALLKRLSPRMRGLVSRTASPIRDESDHAGHF